MSFADTSKDDSKHNLSNYNTGSQTKGGLLINNQRIISKGIQSSKMSPNLAKNNNKNL